PERDLARRGLRRVRAVHEVLGHVAAPLAPEVAADRARGGRGRVRGAGEGAEALDDPVPLDDGGDDGTGGHEAHERAEERLARVLGVVLLEQGGRGGAHVEGDEGVALRLDASQDLADEPARDAVGLDEDEGALGVSHGPNPTRAATPPPTPRTRVSPASPVHPRTRRGPSAGAVSRT